MNAGAPPVLVIVQARLASSRLPGKPLLQAGGRSLLGHLLCRVARSRYPLKVVVATTTSPADDVLVAEAARFGAATFRGSDADVLGRFAGALAENPAEVVVRLTGDNPLVDPRELDRVIDEFGSRRRGPDAVDYATNHSDDERSPLGLAVEVFGADALVRAARDATDLGDREHVTAYFYRVPGRFRVLRTPYPHAPASRLRLTVDTPEDYALVRTLFEALGPDAEIAEIARFLEENLEISRLNAAVVQRTAESEGDLRRRRVAGGYLIGRADASASIGYGHAARLGALLEAWTEVGGRALLIARGIHGSLAKRLDGAGIVLKEPTGAIAHDAANVLDSARSLQARALAVDGHAFDVAYHRELRNGWPLLAIDDLGTEAQVADVILNQNLDFDAGRYGTLQPGQRQLVGAPYALLRRAIREQVEHPTLECPRPGGPRRLALCFGGSDPLALTEPTTAELLKADFDGELHVIVGPGVSTERRAALLARARADTRLRIHVDPPEVGVIFAGADALITAAGVTVWEALALGVPSILVTVAENQRVVAEPLIARGAALDAGPASPRAPRRAAELALELLQDAESRTRLSSTGRRLIDGRGVWRAIDALLDSMDGRTAIT